MAIWQFVFSIVPEKKVALKRNSNTQSDKNSNEFDDSMSWDGYCLSKSSIENISKTLKQTKSWSDNIKQFGCLDETCLELFYDRNILIEVSIRLDLRSLTPSILSSVIDFVKDNQALILTQKGVLLKPVVDDVIKEIKMSDEYSFIKNPQEFLSSLK